MDVLYVTLVVMFVCLLVCLCSIYICVKHTHKLIEHDNINYAVKNKLMRENGADRIKIEEISGPNHQWLMFAWCS